MRIMIFSLHLQHFCVKGYEVMIIRSHLSTLPKTYKKLANQSILTLIGTLMPLSSCPLMRGITVIPKRQTISSAASKEKA